MARFIVLFAACIAAGSCAVARRDAPAPAPAAGGGGGSTALQELQAHAAEFQKTFSEQLGALVSSDNTQQFNKALQDGSDSVLHQLSALSASLQAALGDANGKAKESVEAARAQVQRAADELRRAHPDVEQHAAALKDKLQQAVSDTVKETQKLAQEVSRNVEQTNAKLAPQIKQAYDDFVKQAQQVQQQLHDAAAAKQ